MRVAQYSYNSMSEYADDYQSLTLRNLNNLVCLRSDIHQACDDKDFVFVHKLCSRLSFQVFIYLPFQVFLAKG